MTDDKPQYWSESIQLLAHVAGRSLLSSAPATAADVCSWLRYVATPEQRAEVAKLVCEAFDDIPEVEKRIDAAEKAEAELAAALASHRETETRLSEQACAEAKRADAAESRLAAIEDATEECSTCDQIHELLWTKDHRVMGSAGLIDAVRHLKVSGEAAMRRAESLTATIADATKILHGGEGDNLVTRAKWTVKVSEERARKVVAAVNRSESLTRDRDYWRSVATKACARADELEALRVAAFRWRECDLPGHDCGNKCGRLDALADAIDALLGAPHVPAHRATCAIYHSPVADCDCGALEPSLLERVLIAECDARQPAAEALTKSCEEVLRAQYQVAVAEAVQKGADLQRSMDDVAHKIVVVECERLRAELAAWKRAIPPCDEPGCEERSTNMSGLGDHGCDAHPAGSYSPPWADLVRGETE